MGNQLIQCGSYCTKDPSDTEPHPVFCRRACGLNDQSLVEGCDPAGAVFEETLRHLGELDRTAFTFAASSNTVALRWLFMLGANLEVADSQGTTLLHVACRTGSLAVVQDLVRRTSGLNAPDHAGWTPLHVASCMGRQDISLYLLECGAEAKVRNARGETPEELCSHPFTKEVVVSYAAHPKVTYPRGGGGSQPSQGNNCLHFEPFFVPRDALLIEPEHNKELTELGLHIFNKNAGRGIAFLVATGAVRDYPVEINSVLLRYGADPIKVGEFLSEDFPISQTLRLEFLNSLPLLGTGVVSALQTAFHEMAIPPQPVKVDRLTRGIAHFWWKQHEEELVDEKCESNAVVGAAARAMQKLSLDDFEVTGLELQRQLSGAEALQRLMFSTLMLHEWLQKCKGGMTLAAWAELNAGLENSGADVPMHVQEDIFLALSQKKSYLGCKVSGTAVAASPTFTIEGLAYVQYTGRAQASHNGEMAAWAEASPQALATQGGVSSAGRAGLPSAELPTGAAAALPHGSAPHSVPAEPLSALSHPAKLDATGACREQEDAAWLLLHSWLLFLSPSATDAVPYAFVSLRHAVIKESDAQLRRIRLTASRSCLRFTSTSDAADWLELCLLLGDGRFQSLEAPQLVLRFDRLEDFLAWSNHLRRACCENEGPQQLDTTAKVPAFLSTRNGVSRPNKPSDLQADADMPRIDSQDWPRQKR